MKIIFTYLILVFFLYSCSIKSNIIKFSDIPKSEAEDLKSISNKILSDLIESDEVLSDLVFDKKFSFIEIGEKEVVMNSDSETEVITNHITKMCYNYSVENYLVLSLKLPLNSYRDLDTIHDNSFAKKLDMLNQLGSNISLNLKNAIEIAKKREIKKQLFVRLLRVKNELYWAVISKKKAGVLINVNNNEEVIEVSQELLLSIFGA